MEPTRFDLAVIRLFAPLQSQPLWVDAFERLSKNALLNGFIFAVRGTGLLSIAGFEKRKLVS
jgi:hypothetical protein